MSNDLPTANSKPFWVLIDPDSDSDPDADQTLPPETGYTRAEAARKKFGE
ncbi:MAG: hypothetical protein KAH12_06575 [Anaerolineales bacterium]|nr:hypothetical protein [Anaerolineales bacterium]